MCMNLNQLFFHFWLFTQLPQVLLLHSMHLLHLRNGSKIMAIKRTLYSGELENYLLLTCKYKFLQMRNK